ncbi:MAG: hydroxymethylbilane synthase [Clostridiales bacterium]|nr:hydroxymethylbilane synthase [Eubacteriales bacterium]MDH7565734.1 hydroxymethylbilane synthase [Clostridiales bacterium]
MKRLIKVGSRESKLAMVQTEWVIQEIKKKHPELEFEVIGIKTAGDAILDKTLDKIGGKGLFIKELEHALLDGTVDMAVHSMKDLPAEMPEELTIAAVSKREDPRDVLVSRDGTVLDRLPYGAVIGTSSVRREVQISGKRGDLKFKTLRGNVLTRLNKLLNSEYDAVVLAAAGLKRLGLEERCVQYFGIKDVIPAVGQGVLGVETRRDEDVGFLLDSIHCSESQLAVDAERAFMIKLNGNCSIPIAAHAVIDGDQLKVWGMLASEDKACVYRAFTCGSRYDAAKLGERLADMIIEQMNK